MFSCLRPQVIHRNFNSISNFLVVLIEGTASLRWYWLLYVLFLLYHSDNQYALATIRLCKPCIYNYLRVCLLVITRRITPAKIILFNDCGNLQHDIFLYHNIFSKSKVSNEKVSTLIPGCDLYLQHKLCQNMAGK